ncbi:hypothetical protein F5Y12DRAFT_748101 [Xylaria sp. FL1777]|nr:hypothetical protein F5Y12DRAFT_748101 [Xylaria sp. FL1777]
MYATKFLAIAALTGSALSQKSDSAYCSSVDSSFLSELYEVAPPTPAAILSYLSENSLPPSAPLTAIDFEAHKEELCSLAAELPPSLLPDFKTYGAELLEIGATYSADLVAFITDCSPAAEVASLTSALDFYFTATGNLCAETTAPGSTSSASPVPTATGYYVGPKYTAGAAKL